MQSYVILVILNVDFNCNCFEQSHSIYVISLDMIYLGNYLLFVNMYSVRLKTNSLDVIDSFFIKLLVGVKQK